MGFKGQMWGRRSQEEIVRISSALICAIPIRSFENEGESDAEHR
jgi:hypothetical protein